MHTPVELLQDMQRDTTLDHEQAGTLNPSRRIELRIYAKNYAYTHRIIQRYAEILTLTHEQAGTTTLPPNKLAKFPLCGGGRSRLRLFFMSVCILSRLFLIGRQKFIFPFIFLQEIKWNDYYVDFLSLRFEIKTPQNQIILFSYIHIFLSWPSSREKLSE
jgi:hypothetical protein